MRSSVGLGLIGAVVAAGCCCTGSHCYEPGPGQASVIGAAPIAQTTPSYDPSYDSHAAPNHYDSEGYQKPNSPSYQPDGSQRTAPRRSTAKGTFGHANDYTWLIGRLQRLSTPNLQWKIRYAPLDEEDKWGGSMVLASDVRLNNFADGDVVYIEGAVIAPRPTLYLTGPLYRMRNIRQYGSQQISSLETGEVIE